MVYLRKKLFFRLFLWALSVLFIENTICSMASCMEYDEYLFEKDSNEIFSLIDNKKYIYPMMPDAHFVLNRQEFICQLARKAKSPSDLWCPGATVSTLFSFGSTPDGVDRH